MHPESPLHLSRSTQQRDNGVRWKSRTMPRKKQNHASKPPPHAPILRLRSVPEQWLFHPLFHVYCAQTGSRRSGHRGRRDSLKPWQDGIHQAGTKGPRDELAGTGHGSPEAKAAQSSSSSAGLVSRKQRSRTMHTRVWISRQAAGEHRRVAASTDERGLFC